ncbi:hypothetical protein [Erythrobacter donghaensis]|uniref:hypothetical protein n=1 Tax=Erythrobacter donghaensis TaxID=267135 RepID=UPI00130299C0|nr:hypothetical protein [Erythrobacter donghaensis]
MIPILSDTPAPASALLPGPMPAQGAAGSGTALDFAGLLGAALAPEPGAAPDAPAMPSAANPALALSPLLPAEPGKGLPLAGADLPPPLTDETPRAPSLPAPAEANPARALLTRGGIAIAAPRAAVPVELLQEDTRPALAPIFAEADAKPAVQIADAPAPAPPALPDDLPTPAEAPARVTDLVPVASPEPVADVGEDEMAEADTSPPAPVPLPAPLIAPTPALVATPIPAPLAAVPPPPPTVAMEVQARPLPLARIAAASIRAATSPAPAGSAPAEDAPTPTMPSAATPVEALAEAPAQSAPAPGQQSPAPTLAAAPSLPAAAPERTDAPRAAPPAVQLEQAIDQVGTLREAMRTARPEMTLRHAEFGFVSLRLEQPAPEQWRAVLASRDPGFVPAIQLALAERAVAATADSAASTGHHGGSQNGTGDQRYGASPNGGQGASQPYLGQSGQRDGEAAPDHRRPSTAAALSARAEEEGEAAASPGHHARGTFA